jgi:orotidine-5'-phosphate decarboxylase
MTNSPLIIALDADSRPSALALADRLDPALCRVKVGNELFTRAGPGVVEDLHGRGFQVFLDLKFHDIPNTVAGACRAAAGLGVWMVNVHALGGARMMAAASEAVAGFRQRPRLVAVTVLTSLEAGDLEAAGLPSDPSALALDLAGLARDNGLDGVVCSAREAADMRSRLGRDWLLVTPGIRPGGAGQDDQRRTMTPAQALAAGSDYLVVGRPVTDADDPAAALRTMTKEMR